MFSQKLKQAFAASALCCAATAGAAQYGGSFTLSRGEIGEDNIDYDRNEIGFALATGNAESFFSYRLNVSLINGDADGADLSGIGVDNTFGFAVHRSPGRRLWAGPAVGIGFGEFEGGGESVDAVDFTVGGTFGGDFVVSPSMTLVVEAGLRFGFVAIDIEDNGPEDDDSLETSQFLLRGSLLFGGQ